jgi:hypothetical protein
MCNFTTVSDTGPVLEKMLPWISIENTAGIVKLSTIWKGMGGVYDINNVCPVFVAPYVEN